MLDNKGLCVRNKPSFESLSYCYLYNYKIISMVAIYWQVSCSFFEILLICSNKTDKTALI
jgi:hypothetical protein